MPPGRLSGGGGGVPSWRKPLSPLRSVVAHVTELKAMQAEVTVTQQMCRRDFGNSKNDPSLDRFGLARVQTSMFCWVGHGT